ncbi:MAG: MaoC family dehydratase [Acidimicrobiia bacterium]|nr:MAG: MaoC family dehydratase [Acidimicrobiia bacterium]
MTTVPVDQLDTYIGKEIGRGEWFEIDQDRIDAFARITMDDQWIHTDREAAAKGPFGTTIAHGFLTLSLLSYLMGDVGIKPAGATLLVNYGSDKVRFLAPVRVGSRIRSVATLTGVREKSQGQYLLTQNVVIEIEGEDTPALVADVLTLAAVPSDS